MFITSAALFVTLKECMIDDNCFTFAVPILMPPIVDFDSDDESEEKNWLNFEDLDFRLGASIV